MKYKIIDLTYTLQPAREERRLTIRHFVHPVYKTHMHQIDTESHIGTHIEAPSHYFREEGKDITQLPVETFVGEARILDLTFLSSGQHISPADLKRAGGDSIKERDIVIFRGPAKVAKPPAISGEAAEWLVSKGIKMVGIDNTIGLEVTPGEHASHRAFLKNQVPIIENLVNLEKLSKEKKYFLAALPLKIFGLESGLTRVVAIEGLIAAE